MVYRTLTLLLCLPVLLISLATYSKEPKPGYSKSSSLQPSSLEPSSLKPSSLKQYRGGNNYNGYLLAYENDGLGLNALVAIPNAAKTGTPLPILIANHGNHPNPPKYGITKAGLDWRPGDYYRRIPGAFAAHGYIVVMPDYRGHNNSAGIEFTQSYRSTTYYAQDVLALLPHLAQIPGVAPEQIFMWGHSMGGEVSLLALLQTDRIKAASLWSTVGGSPWEQAYYYSHQSQPLATHTQPAADSVSELKESTIPPNVQDDGNATQQLLALSTPLQLHHAVDDKGALYAWSRRLASQLTFLSKPHTFFTYRGADHLFEGDQFNQAIKRDVAFFRKIRNASLNAKRARPD